MLSKLTHLFKQFHTVLFAGVGNVLKHDDGAGVYICSKIKKSNRVESHIVGLSIENYIGKINKINPDVLVLVDCVYLNQPPGYASLLPVEEIRDYTFHTHNISLKRLSEFFRMPVYVLAIQPEDVSFGEGMTNTIRQSSDEIIDLINNFKE